MSHDQIFEIVKIILDKLLIGLIVAGFVAYLTRHVEKFKSSLSWNSSIQKERLELARRSQKEVIDLQKLHLHQIGQKFIPQPNATPPNLLAKLDSMEFIEIEMSILGASSELIGAFRKVLSVVANDISNEPFEGAGRVSGAEIQQPNQNANAEFEKRKNDMKYAVRDFFEQLKSGFAILNFNGRI